MKLFLEVTQDEYQLPLFVASSVPELSRKTGWKIKRIWTYLNHVRHGNIKHPRFVEVVFDECCGTCVWHKPFHLSDKWVCVNSESKFCFDCTGCRQCCDKYEEG